MLMAGFIKICSVHTPSSNPKLPPPKPLPGKTMSNIFITQNHLASRTEL